MSTVNTVNHFFNKKIYRSLDEFAFSPISWMGKGGSDYCPNISNLLIGAVLWPVLVPAVIVTGAISLVLAGIAALMHGLAFIGASIADGVKASSDDTEVLLAP